MREEAAQDQPERVADPQEEGAAPEAGAPEPVAEPPGGGSHDLQREVAEAIAEAEGSLFLARRRIAELEAQIIRLRADFDNYRRRTRRELAEAEERGKATVIGALLPALDNLERARVALQEAGRGELAAGTAEDATGHLASLAQGVEMVYDQLLRALEAQGLEAVPALGGLFDPRLHESVATAERPDRPEGEVVAEVERGWRLGERVLRPARVVVAARPEAAKDEEAKDE